MLNFIFTKAEQNLKINSIKSDYLIIMLNLYFIINNVVLRLILSDNGFI